MRIRYLRFASSTSKILTSKSNTKGDLMRVSTKGQVTIPLPVREKTGVVPGSEVEFHVEGNRIYIVKTMSEGRGEALLQRMTGKGTVKMSTEEILRHTRGQ